MSEISFQNEAAGWPGGWYIYENGKVEGPYSAVEAFARGDESIDGKQRLVSRKGFSQWYALKDLSEIFRMTETLGRKVSGAAAELTETQILRFKADVSAGATPAMAARAAVTPPATPVSHPTPTPPRVKAKHIESSVTKPEARMRDEAPRSKPVLAGAAAEVPPERLVAAPQVSRPAVSQGPRATNQPMSGGKRLASTPAQAQLQEYFMARNRLRLGKIRNPWMSAFVGAPLSLGVYWGVWLSQLAKEITWHTKQANENTKALGILAMIPLVHFYAVFQLAKRLREMEMQNRYASVSPFVACLFGIIPPFALAYLQDAANRHWLLHVKYSVAKPKTSA